MDFKKIMKRIKIKGIKQLKKLKNDYKNYL